MKCRRVLQSVSLVDLARQASSSHGPRAATPVPGGIDGPPPPLGQSAQVGNGCTGRPSPAFESQRYQPHMALHCAKLCGRKAL